jgi:hypothetical protein
MLANRIPVKGNDIDKARASKLSGGKPTLLSQTSNVVPCLKLTNFGAGPVCNTGSAAAAASTAGARGPAVQPQPRAERLDPGQRRGDIMATLPSGQIDILDIVVTHPARRDLLGQTCSRAGFAAKRAKDGKARNFRRFGDRGQYEFVPFAVESYGRLGASVQNFLKRMGDVAAGRGKISKSAFVKSAYREVSCALQRGNGMMCARLTLNLARASGRHFMSGCDVPVQEKGLV